MTIRTAAAVGRVACANPSSARAAASTWQTASTSALVGGRGQAGSDPPVRV
ncbi:hypothetical protein [Streptomyces mirabilis]|uniref:hypothetical protein n=1 Tax=Streptomyces mirabilis TaxID=68239 RepID=UPI0036B629E6